MGVGIRILAAGLAVAALGTAAPPRADRAGVVLGRPPTPAAEGLLVPGRGPTFSRQEALDALDEIPRARCPCPYLIYITLPRAPAHEYEGLERIWISGPDYPPGSMLVSDRTRIAGLISIHDLAPTVEALDEGREPPITARHVDDVDSRLAGLEHRLNQVHETRGSAALVLAGFVALFTALAILRRSPFLGRAALLSVPVALAAALALSALEVTARWSTVLGLAAACAAGAPLLAAATLRRRVLALALLAIFPVYLVVLSVSTETSSLAAIGPWPENGGRFYGFPNQVETMLLVPALLGAALLGPALLGLIALFVLVTVGSSFAGADGGGLLVFSAGFLFLWLRLRRVPLTARNLVLAGAAVVAVGLAVVGVDAALGGSSHVTRSLSGGPLEVVEDIARRLWETGGGFVSSLHAVLILGVSLPGLVWLALRRPRYAVLDAVLVALAVSLVVNDSPRDIAAWGALSAAALRFWWESTERVE